MTAEQTLLSLPSSSMSSHFLHPNLSQEISFMTSFQPHNYIIFQAVNKWQWINSINLTLIIYLFRFSSPEFVPSNQFCDAFPPDVCIIFQAVDDRWANFSVFTSIIYLCPFPSPNNKFHDTVQHDISSIISPGA